MSATPDTPTPPASLREALRAAGTLVTNARRTLGMVVQVDRRLLATLVACQVFEALGTVAIAAVGKQLVDAVVLAARAHAGTRAALTWVAIEFLLVMLLALTSQVNTYAQVVLRSKLGLHVNLLILEKASNVSYGHFEDPEFMNKMTQARREASTRPLDLVNQVLTLVRSAITLAGYGALLWSLGPWAVLLVAALALPPFWAEARHGRAQFLMRRARTERFRKSFYLEQVLTNEQSVKEVKLFALARWLMDRYHDIETSFHREEVALARRHARASFALGLAAAVALYATYALIAARAIAGAISLGSMTLYIVVFRQGQTTLQNALKAIAKAYENNLFMTNLFEYLAVPDDEPHGEIEAGAFSETAPPCVEFRDVSFRYPGSEHDALSHIDLTIGAGETIALVGKNGAGKTTLIKLLVGLYRPTSGTILIDGVDTATMPPSELRRRIGVIFQDFARFQFSAGDNIGIGWLPARTDVEAIEHAIEEAGAREVIARLPKGLETPLGRAFGGDDLSVGQWQRVALARAFMRRSRILVLDEPTAAMDAEAEHEIFQRFRDLKANRTALLITHRFSTVRMADRIVVFEGGRVVEQGSHATLMAAGGRYATMFKLQAQGYELDVN